VYSIAPSSPVPFYYRSLYVIVIDSKSHWLYVLLLLSPSNSSVSSLLYPLAFVGSWWDLRRDSLFSYLRIILALGVFQGLCGVRIINIYIYGYVAFALKILFLACLIEYCKGNLTILRRILHLDLAKGNPKRTL
jgi:hypothetical protein